jgi:hypothetical protein
MEELCKSLKQSFLKSTSLKYRNVSPGTTGTLTFTGESTDMVFVEHVVLVLNLQFDEVTEDDLDRYLYDYYNGGTINWPARGKITVSLTSPSGTISTLLPQRILDIYPNSYDDWPLLSLHFWGEEPAGTWTITITHGDSVGPITVSVPRVTIYGTARIPEAVSRIPDTCSSECDSTRGCAALGANFCDACANLRVLSSDSTLECVATCPEAKVERNGYCYNSTASEASCDAEMPTRSSSPTLLSTWSNGFNLDQPFLIAYLTAVLV